jgi:transposase
MGDIMLDLSSSYFEGATCPLAQLGYSRDGKKGKSQVNYGLLTDARGCPVAVSVYAGNTADPQTLLPEIDRLRNDFGIAQLVMVGDRGMITQNAIETLRGQEGIGWITALKSGAIRALIKQGQRQHRNAHRQSGRCSLMKRCINPLLRSPGLTRCSPIQ